MQAIDVAGIMGVLLSQPAGHAISGHRGPLRNRIGVAVVAAMIYVCSFGSAGAECIDYRDYVRWLGSVESPNCWASGVAVWGTHAYVADLGYGLQVIDITNPQDPQVVGSVSMPDQAIGVAVSGTHAYIADGVSGLQVVDITNPQSPQIVGSVDTPGFARGVALAGIHAYVALSSGLQVIDITNPASPQIVGSVDTPGDAFGVAASGTQLLVADGGAGLQILPLQCETTPPPEPFLLLSPANADTTDTTEPTLAWQTARETVPGDTVRYTVYWSRDSTFSSADSVAAGTDTTYTIAPSTLLGGSTYYWKVRAWDIHGIMRWSAPSGGWIFYTPEVTPIGLTLQTQISSAGILLTWGIPADMHPLGFTVYWRVLGSEDWLRVSPLLIREEATVTFVDADAEPGVQYEYEVEVVGPSGPEGRWGPVSAELPAVTLWLGLSPNPGRQTLTVNFGMPQPGNATLRLFNTAGREVAREAVPHLRAGNHSITWTPGEGQLRRVASGAYWIRLDTPAGWRTARWTVIG